MIEVRLLERESEEIRRHGDRLRRPSLSFKKGMRENSSPVENLRKRGRV